MVLSIQSQGSSAILFDLLQNKLNFYFESEAFHVIICDQVSGNLKILHTSGWKFKEWIQNQTIHVGGLLSNKSNISVIFFFFYKIEVSGNAFFCFQCFC